MTSVGANCADGTQLPTLRDGCCPYDRVGSRLTACVISAQYAVTVSPQVQANATCQSRSHFTPSRTPTSARSITTMACVKLALLSLRSILNSGLTIARYARDADCSISSTNRFPPNLPLAAVSKEPRLWLIGPRLKSYEAVDQDHEHPGLGRMRILFQLSYLATCSACSWNRRATTDERAIPP
jgi:hypothetical protein